MALETCKRHNKWQILVPSPEPWNKSWRGIAPLRSKLEGHLPLLSPRFLFLCRTCAIDVLGYAGTGNALRSIMSRHLDTISSHVHKQKPVEVLNYPCMVGGVLVCPAETFGSVCQIILETRDPVSLDTFRSYFMSLIYDTIRYDTIQYRLFSRAQKLMRWPA